MFKEAARRSTSLPDVDANIKRQIVGHGGLDNFEDSLDRLTNGEP